MDNAAIRSTILGLASDLDGMKRETAAELLVLRTIIKAVVPHLTDEAKASIDKAVRAVSDSTQEDDIALDWIRVQLLPLELNVLLPVHKAD